MAISKQNVNIFLQSETAEGLIRLQLINNALNGVHYNYQTPMYDGSNWFVWFFADVNRWQNPSGMSEDEMNIVQGAS